MKTRKLRILSALLALAMLFTLLPTAAFAADTPADRFDVGNLKYEVIDEAAKTAKMVGFADDATDKANIEVPAKVTWNNTEYSVIKIQDGTFRGNNTLKNVTLHEGLQTMGKYAFYGCEELESIRIPSTVTSIENYCFQDCGGLATVTFAPDSKLETIGQSAFCRTKLSEITIPAAVTSIGECCFLCCYTLNCIIVAPGSQLGPNSIGFLGDTSQFNNGMDFVCYDENAMFAIQKALQNQNTKYDRSRVKMCGTWNVTLDRKSVV